MIGFVWRLRRAIAMDQITKKLQSAYDAVAYESGVYRQSHPRQIAVVGLLAGLAPANVESCRILEIGCASGSNLLPMAEQLPASRFLGIDLSQRQIETGSNIVRELKLTNIELRCQDIMDFPVDAGQFDYIIAHGIYSWVPPAVQQKLLEICRAHLATQGLALISYNTYPGWRVKEIAREMMLYHARNAADAAQSIARGREIVQFVSEHATDTGYYRDAMRHNHQRTLEGSDQYILHDHMETVNEPRYFWRFMEEAHTHGLAYVAESGADADPWVRISKPVREEIAKMSADRLEREQYLDFLVNRTFRSSVLCLTEAADVTKSPSPNHIRRLQVAGNPPEVDDGKNAQGLPRFKFGEGNYQVVLSDPRSIAVLRHLRRAWPASVPFAELVTAYINQSAIDPGQNKAVEALERLVEAYYGLGIVELWTGPCNRISPTPGIYPRATRYARWQAVHNVPVISLRHSAANLDDAFRQLLPLLDGTHDRKALAAEILRRSQTDGGTAWPNKTPKELDQLIESALKLMAGSSLLLKEPEGS